MGAPRNEYGRALYSDVQAQVTLTRPFEIGRTEVTNAMWLAEGFELPLREVDVGECRDSDCPISNVNLFEVVTFLNRYSERRGLPPCYDLSGCTGTFGSGPICRRPGERSGLLDCEREAEDGLNCEQLLTTAQSVYDCPGYRLPTEAEWEYSARAGTRTAFWTGPITWPSGAECEQDELLDPIAWYCHNSGGRQHRVGEKPPNPWGLRDMLGNVHEWTSDAFYGLGYGTSPLTDPMGHWWDVAGRAERNLMPIASDEGEPEPQRILVTRGGNYLFTAEGSKASERSYVAMVHQGGSPLGFRIVRTLLP